MPKYFDGAKPLPFPLLRFTPNKLTRAKLSSVLRGNPGGVSISIWFPELSADSLGYVFHVQPSEQGWTVCDITERVHFRQLRVDQLHQCLMHAAGVEYSVEWQKEFARVRNEIGLDQ